MTAEPLAPGTGPPLWWLSFCDPARAEGTRFLGALVIQAPSFPDAVTLSHKLGVNPGGEIQGAGPIPATAYGTEWRGRLLTAEEVDAMPDPEA